MTTVDTPYAADRPLHSHLRCAAFRPPFASRNIAPKAVLVGAVLTVLRVASAQAQFDELPGHTFPPMLWTGATVVGDVNGDGSLDVVFGTGGQSRLLLNSGRATFADVTASHLPPNNNGTYALALGDVDGDGDLDLVQGAKGSPAYSSQDRLYRNDGSGVFVDVTSTCMPASIGETRAVVIGDVDDDGDLDLMMSSGSGYSAYQARLYLNNGNGVFADVSATRVPALLAATNALALGDVDGDADFDLIVGNGGSNWLWLNDGAGTFTDVTAAQMPSCSAETTSLALGDVDGDGDLDVVCGTIPWLTGGCWGGKMPPLYYATPEPNRLLLNDGQGAFHDAPANMPGVGDLTMAVALGDVDGDGDLDIVCGNLTLAGTDRVHLNNGAGVFTDVTATHLPAASQDTPALALGDLDGDGDIDVVRSGMTPRLQLNLRRQLHAPSPMRIGHVYTLDAYSRRSPAGTLDAALVYLSTSPQSVPIPTLGTLGIVPVAPLPPIAIPQPAGVGSTTWNVPNVPVLAGLTVYAQALLVNFPLGARLTNVTRGVVVL